MNQDSKFTYPSSIACYLCGVDSPLTREVRSVLAVGNRWATIEDEFYRCPRCEEVVYLGGMGDATSRKAAAVIRAEDGLLGPDEIVGLREKYGLSQAELERLIGAGEKTVVRWERGTVSQNKTADTLLRVLSDHPDVVKQLAAERGVKPKERAAKPRRTRRATSKPATAAKGRKQAEAG
jgi:HTH-type transcriptional regulator/antitoxin MqsA